MNKIMPTIKQGAFLSTPSARRATWWTETNNKHREISIHALREEGDYRGRRFC